MPITPLVQSCSLAARRIHCFTLGVEAMTKITTILATICGVLGVPWAGLVWLAAGMRAAPSFGAEDLGMSLPVPCLAILFVIASLYFCRQQHPEQKASRWLIAVLVVSVLTIALLVVTYFDMRRPRYL